VSNWTWDEVKLRNLRISGVADPIGALPERLAEDLPETVIEAECCKLLAEDGWRTLKTDPVSRRAHGKGFGELGMADTLALRYRSKSVLCEAIWIEWKSHGGRVQKHQTEWHTKERARGAITIIAGIDFPTSVEGFREWYRAAGLVRSRIW
jgi:hypothetical protein